jgi:hypothetical protein
MEQQVVIGRIGRFSQGFSLIELGMVIFLMGMFSLLMIPRWSPSSWQSNVTSNQLIVSLRALQWRQMHDAELSYMFLIDNEQHAMGEVVLNKKVPCQSVSYPIHQPKSWDHDQVIQRYQQPVVAKLPICFDTQGRPLGAIAGCNGPCLSVVDTSPTHICISAGGDIRACQP